VDDPYVYNHVMVKLLIHTLIINNMTSTGVM
jgi:hypothetical protein